MKEIPLTKNKVALVDDKDFKYLSQWKWHYAGSGYAARRDYPSRKYVYMHRQILKAQPKQEVDHINYDTLDNTRKNIRIVDRSLNMANTKVRSTNTSGFKGVCWDKQRNKWAAEITVNYKSKHLGRFDSKIQAAKVYNEAAKKVFGEFARLNLIDV